MHYRLVCTLCYTICIPLISCALIMVSCMDYGRPLKPFFTDFPKFLANWVDRPNKFWVIFSLTLSPHLGSISLIYVVVFLQITLLFRPNPNISQI